MIDSDGTEMTDNSDTTTEYVVVTEEALQYLPEEWRNQLRSMADDGRAVLKSVDPELSQLSRLMNSFSTLVSLKHVCRRLTDYKFAAEMPAILELDMLTTAFVVTYVRLFHGGNASGFSRNALPAALRPVHDEILALRNKRFAHNDDHPSVENGMEISFDTDRFHVTFNLQLGYYIGGSKGWHELVDFLDEFIASRLETLFQRLREKTAREWSYPTGPEPEWVRPSE